MDELSTTSAVAAKLALSTVRLVVSAAGLALAAAGLLISGCGQNLTHPDPPDPYQGSDAGVLDCLPNLDGRIDADELRAAIGVPVSYLVSPSGATRAVDLAGVVGADGKRVWDWSVPAGDDQAAELQARAVAGEWFAASFPSGQFAAPIDAGASLLGVYRHDDEALWLLGIASTDPAPAEGETLLVYNQPIAVTRFPLVDGAEWVATAQIMNGTLRGLPYAGSDTYEVRVDGAGKIALPDLSFTQAFRVRTKVTVAPAAGQSVVRRQVSFMFECFGEVARATSQDNETQEDFTTAAEVRRLAL